MNRNFQAVFTLENRDSHVCPEEAPPRPPTPEQPPSTAPSNAQPEIDPRTFSMTEDMLSLFISMSLEERDLNFPINEPDFNRPEEVFSQG